MKFYVYVILSKKNKRFYIGSTNNLTRRIAEHNKGQTKSTRYTRPFELIYYEEYNTRADAIYQEKFLKSGQGRASLKKYLKNGVRAVAKGDRSEVRVLPCPQRNK